MTHLLVFSHLRWDFVYQRPQHLLSRLARSYPVVFVEEPIESKGESRLEASSPCEGVTVLKWHSPLKARGFHDDHVAGLRGMLQSHLEGAGVEDIAAWFYTPMALPLLDGLQPRAIVYDCMDELAAFKNAPLQMRQRESALLRRADLVLAGGPRLYESKAKQHPNVVCLPSAVDAWHYDPERIANDGALSLAARVAQGAKAGPRLGYFGVIDERLDLALIAALARSHPEWDIVMAGPVVKIAADELPRATNLHWIGQQPYPLLPSLVADWDVCLMPFALNESTAFISPTKTLEYLAAGKPVVSTPIHDVRVLFSDVVAIAESTTAFLKACQAAMDESSSQRAGRLVRSKACVEKHSWESAAATACRMLESALRLRSTNSHIPPERGQRRVLRAR